ncbi:MAG: molybdopterin molybdenumtransferase MoeA, partial [Dongiaceae bacterium]
ALVCAIMFLRPAIEVMLGRIEDARLPETALLGCDLEENDSREDYLRSRLNRDVAGQLVATPYPKQDSSMLLVLARADCLVVRPVRAPAVKAGTKVEIVRLSGSHLSI